MRPSDVIAGRFVIEREVAAGGMGRVYRAHDRHLNAPVAIKVILDPERAEIDRFVREAAILSEVRHPAIVRYIAHGQTPDERHYIAMEWLEGQDLARRLRFEEPPTLSARGAATAAEPPPSRGLSVGEALHLARRIAEALGELHSRGLVHRDVKPSNIFLVDGRTDQPKLLDFGVARDASASLMTGTGVLVGTPMYMAPEQARGARDVGARADVWALGCVLFESIAARAPFRGAHAMAILAKILLEDAPRLRDVQPSVPTAVDELVASLLAKEAADRPADGAHAAKEIAEVERALADGGDANWVPSRTPSRSSRVLSSRTAVSISGDERRVHCVVLAAPPPTERADQTLGSGADENALEQLRRIVEAHAGKLEPLRDGSILVSVAGARTPVDQAMRAARIALAIRREVPEAPMVVATGRAESSGTILVGALLDRAARELATSGRGKTRLDAATADLIDARFVVRRDDEGITLLGEREGETDERRLLGRITPLVGRDRELRSVEGIWEECVEEPIARVLLITAPAGAGKTRLRGEIVRRVRAHTTDVEVFFAQGDSLSSGSPFVMIAPAIRRSAGILDGEPLPIRREKLRARVERHVAANERSRVLEFLGELTGIPSATESDSLRAARRDPMLMGDAMRSAFETFLGAEARAHPVLFVLEDLHWGDLPAVRFIDAALRTLRDAPFMVLALARPEVHKLFPNLWSERAMQEVRLDALSRRASERLVREVLGERATDAVCATIIERAAGNAFFLEELIRAAAQGGDTLPETVLATLEARLDALGSDAKRLLRAASVFGEVFWRGGVGALIGERSELLERLDELVEREVIGRSPTARIPGETEYVFRHALLRDAAYETLVERDRALAHGVAGEWLEGRGETDALVLAEHFARGGQRARAATWFRRAAEHALEGNDLAATIEHGNRAIGLLDDDARTARGALRSLQAVASYWKSAYAEAVAFADEACALLPAGSVGWFRAAAEGTVSSARRGDYERVERWLTEIRAAKPYSDAIAAQIVALCRGTFQLIFAGRFEAADALLDEIRARVPDLSQLDPATEGQVHHVQGVRFAHGGRVGQFLVELEAAIDGFERAGDVRNATLERPTVGWCYAELGELARAEEILRGAMEACEQLGVQQTRTYALVNLGYVLELRGRLDEAEAALLEAGAACRAQGNPRLEGWSRAHLAGVHLLRGDSAAAEREARTAESSLVMAPGLRAWARATLARALLQAGRASEALSFAEQAMADLERLGSMLQGESLPPLVLAEVRDALGDRAGARAAIADAKRRLYQRADALPDANWRASFLSLADHVRTLSLADTLA